METLPYDTYIPTRSKFLLEQRDVSVNCQKWLTKLLDNDLEIIYKTRVDNKVADSLCIGNIREERCHVRCYQSYL